MSIAWTIFITLAVSLTIKEYRKEKREHIQKYGMTRKQLLRTYKHMRGQNGQVSYKELLQNMNND